MWHGAGFERAVCKTIQRETEVRETREHARADVVTAGGENFGLYRTPPDARTYVFLGEVTRLHLASDVTAELQQTQAKPGRPAPVDLSRREDKLKQHPLYGH